MIQYNVILPKSFLYFPLSFLHTSFTFLLFFDGPGSERGLSCLYCARCTSRLDGHHRYLWLPVIFHKKRLLSPWRLGGRFWRLIFTVTCFTDIRMPSRRTTRPFYFRQASVSSRCILVARWHIVCWKPHCRLLKSNQIPLLPEMRKSTRRDNHSTRS